MRKIVAFLGICVLCTAAGGPERLPSAEEVIDRYIQALGGKQALQAVTSRAASGSFHMPTFGDSGAYRELYQRPNRLLRTFQVEGYGIVQICFDGNTAWMESPEYGVESLDGMRLAEARRDAGFEDPLRLQEVYAGLTVKRSTRLEDRTVFEILAESADGAADTLFFDVETGLLLCRETRETARDGSSRPARTYYEDYQERAGVRHALTMRYVRDDLIRITRRDVVVNAPMDPATHKKP